MPQLAKAAAAGIRVARVARIVIFRLVRHMTGSSEVGWVLNLIGKTGRYRLMGEPTTRFNVSGSSETVRRWRVGRRVTKQATTRRSACCFGRAVVPTGLSCRQELKRLSRPQTSSQDERARHDWHP
jgi:hypothetical protein